MNGLGAVEPGNPAAAPSMLKGRKVLVVEDEMLVAMLVEELLGEFGCEVAGIAASVPEALAQLEKSPDVDLAILDVNLGGEKSFPVAQTLIDRQVPFLFATGYGPADIAQRFPGVTLLHKPYSPRALAQSLAGILPS